MNEYISLCYFGVIREYYLKCNRGSELVFYNNEKYVHEAK